MNKTINIDGAEFELVPVIVGKLKGVANFTDGSFTLKPIAPKLEKKEYLLQLCGLTGCSGSKYETKLDLTEPQAEAVADAIKALMEYLFNPAIEEEEEFTKQQVTMGEARQLIQGED